ncbi:hypothetical protein B4113_3306 [Geobacillus sp. B4113_201601]|nr:hypothetical protein B4113_3306 [Geobacillus sp. B4113_201601]
MPPKHRQKSRLHDVFRFRFPKPLDIPHAKKRGIVGAFAPSSISGSDNAPVPSGSIVALAFILHRKKRGFPLSYERPFHV